MEALALAQQTKAAQRSVRREIRDGGAEVAARLLREPTDAAGSIRLDRFLGAITRYGPTRSRKALASAGMHPGRLSRRVRELTADERRRLAAVIES